MAATDMSDIVSEQENQHVRFIKIACDEARKAHKSGDGYPFGAVVVKYFKDSSLKFVCGHNLCYKNIDPTAHGEIVAIRNTCAEWKAEDLRGCILYTSSYPCDMCFSACRWANIDSIYYCTTCEDLLNHGHATQKYCPLITDEQRKQFASIERVYLPEMVEFLENTNPEHQK